MTTVRKYKCKFCCMCITNDEQWLEEINQALASYSDIRLEIAKDGQIADISFVDSIFVIKKAQGIILFFSGELSVHNPLLMDYSVLLTQSSPPHSYQTMRTILSLVPVLNRLTQSSSSRGDPSSTDTVCLGSKEAQTAKTRFCCFVCRRSMDWRNRFVQSLSRRKRVDCPGVCLNNMERIGHKVKDKIEWMKHYKFAIAFENLSLIHI